MALMQIHDPVRFDAYARLLARPDPSDLPRRAHVARCEGDPNRRATRFPAIFMGWLQRRHLETDFPEPLMAATRMLKPRARPVNPGLRVLRPTGTGPGHLSVRELTVIGWLPETRGKSLEEIESAFTGRAVLE